MATFQDKSEQTWEVKLDPVILLEIQDTHGIRLTNLEADPMQGLRNDPMTLVAVIHMICEEQIKERQLSPKDFAKLLPFPPDVMLKAIQTEIPNFFPTGRHSHVAGVLAEFEKMGAETDELTTEKMRKIVSDPATKTRLSELADQEIQKAMAGLMTDSKSGT